jgi:hypothetical protein
MAEPVAREMRGQLVNVGASKRVPEILSEVNG